MLRPMNRTLATLTLTTLILGLLAARGALAATPQAGTAVVNVEAPASYVGAEAMYMLVQQALADHGVTTVDAPLASDAAPPSAAGQHRFFVLHLAPLDGATVTVLKEVDPQSRRTLFRSSLVIDTPQDADRVIRRLVAAVLAREDVVEGATVATVTEHEGREFAKRPGEFLWGFRLLTGFAAPKDADTVPFYGGTADFLYEMEHVNFGASFAGAGSGDSALFAFTVRANYLFLDSDISPYLGGGLGISSLWVDKYDGKFGAHGLVSAGVEMFRLHATRLLVGVDVLLPFYRLDPEWEDTFGSAYVPVPMLSVGIVW